MKRHILALVGMACAILGVSTVADTMTTSATALPCPNKSAAAKTIACASDKLICDGQSYDDCVYDYSYFQVNDFPNGCVKNDPYQTGGTKCSRPSANCYRLVYCTWRSGKCVTGAGRGPWYSGAKPTTKPC